jgi:hypothetical protein
MAWAAGVDFSFSAQKPANCRPRTHRRPAISFTSRLDRRVAHPRGVPQNFRGPFLAIAA